VGELCHSQQCRRVTRDNYFLAFNFALRYVVLGLKPAASQLDNIRCLYLSTIVLFQTAAGGGGGAPVVYAVCEEF
jgi:hypothetical protein